MNDYINDSCLEAWKKTIQEMTEDELLDIFENEMDELRKEEECDK